MCSFNNSFLCFDLKIGSETACLISQCSWFHSRRPECLIHFSRIFVLAEGITIRVSRKMKMNCRCFMEVTREIIRELFATKFIHKNQCLLSLDILNLKETKFLKQWSSVITIACLVYYSYGCFLQCYNSVDCTRTSTRPYQITISKIW